MKKSKVLVITMITVLLIGLFALPAGAQSPLTAEVDRTQLSTDEALLLTVTVDTSAGQPSRPVLTTLDGFQMAGSSSGTQLSIVNGNMRSAATYRYTLRPLQAGQLIIGEVAVDINGQTYTTQPISINVSQGTGQIQPAPSQTMPNMPSMGNFPAIPGFPNLNNFFNNAPGGSLSNSAPPLDPADAPTELVGQDFFIEGQVDNPSPYQGEQIVYTFRFYQAANLYDQPQYQPPGFSGFWSQDLDDEQTDYTTEAAGRTYRVTELQTVLFPTVVDELTIDPAQLTIPGDFFSRGQVLQTQPVTVSVQPLPENAPASFQGAIGQYAIQAQADKTETMVNDTITLSVAIAGRGNLDALADPVWTEGPEWRAFDSKATVDTRFENGIMEGTRIYERLLVPTQPGSLTLPPIEFSFFNPASGSYETATSEAIQIQVQGDGSSFSVPQAPAASAGAAPAAVGSTLPTGTGPAAGALRPNKAAAELNPSSSLPLTARSSFWLLFTVPFFLLAGHFGWQRYQQQRLNTADSRRSKKASGRAASALREAQKENQAQSIGVILTAYLEEKLNQRLSGFSQAQLANLLTNKGANQDLAARTTSCLMRSEMRRYAPAGTTAVDGDLFTAAKQIIDELEGTLSA
jgi:hypothetical protein